MFVSDDIRCGPEGITLRGDKCPAMMEVETLCPRKQGWKPFNGCEELLLHVEEECSGEAKLVFIHGACCRHSNHHLYQLLRTKAETLELYKRALMFLDQLAADSKQRYWNQR